MTKRRSISTNGLCSLVATFAQLYKLSKISTLRVVNEFWLKAFSA